MSAGVGFCARKISAFAQPVGEITTISPVSEVRGIEEVVIVSTTTLGFSAGGVNNGRSILIFTGWAIPNLSTKTAIIYITITLFTNFANRSLQLPNSKTYNYYARIERGEENPSLEVLKGLATALKVRASDFLPF